MSMSALLAFPNRVRSSFGENVVVKARGTNDNSAREMLNLPTVGTKVVQKCRPLRAYMAILHSVIMSMDLISFC